MRVLQRNIQKERERKREPQDNNNHKELVWVGSSLVVFTRLMGIIRGFVGIVLLSVVRCKATIGNFLAAFTWVYDHPAKTEK